MRGGRAGGVDLRRGEEKGVGSSPGAFCSQGESQSWWGKARGVGEAEGLWGRLVFPAGLQGCGLRPAS